MIKKKNLNKGTYLYIIKAIYDIVSNNSTFNLCVAVIQKCIWFLYINFIFCGLATFMCWFQDLFFPIEFSMYTILPLYCHFYLYMVICLFWPYSTSHDFQLNVEQKWQEQSSLPCSQYHREKNQSFRFYHIEKAPYHTYFAENFYHK